MELENFEIIDFHTHPFTTKSNNICSHKDYFDMSIEGTKNTFEGLGISRICGSVISIENQKAPHASTWERIVEDNNTALRLRDIYKGFYVPGFHVHPDFVQESIKEIRRMSCEGVKLIGELCPYAYSWDDYSCKGFSEILDEAEKYGMAVSIHTMNDNAIDEMVKNHPNTTIVAAHPGEYDSFMRHLSRMKMSNNYYLDLSGTGLFRYGMLRRAITEVGADRILFGTDYPTCNPAMFVGGLLWDDLITDEEKKLIFSENAKRILKL